MPNIVCPTCATKLEIDDDMVGQDVQCGSCQQVFKAETKTKRSSRRGETDEDETPRKSKYRKDDDEEEDRPSKRRRMSRDEDDEDYEDRPSRRRKTNQGGTGMGMTSMILGIVGLIVLIPSCLCCILLGIPLPLMSVIFGVISLKTPGKNMGIAGIVMGSIGLLIVLLGFILSLAGMGMNAAGAGPGGGGGRFNNQNRFK